jgi:hypothetical protein
MHAPSFYDIVLTAPKESGSIREGGTIATIFGPGILETNGPHSSHSESASEDEPKFTLFPKLAIELRQMIWCYAADLIEPQTIKIKVQGIHKYRRRGRYHIRRSIENKVRCTIQPDSYNVPGLLQVSPEALQAITTITKKYHLSFKKELGGKPIYVNFTRDTLYFESVVDFLAFDRPEVRQVVLAGSAPTDVREVLFPKQTLLEKELQYLAICDSLSPELITIISLFEKLKGVVLEDVSMPEGDVQLNMIPDFWRMITEASSLAFHARPTLTIFSPQEFNKKFGDNHSVSLPYQHTKELIY